jgi:hypothetical protein
MMGVPPLRLAGSGTFAQGALTVAWRRQPRRGSLLLAVAERAVAEHRCRRVALLGRADFRVAPQIGQCRERVNAYVLVRSESVAALSDFTPSR